MIVQVDNHANVLARETCAWSLDVRPRPATRQESALGGRPLAWMRGGLHTFGAHRAAVGRTRTGGGAVRGEAPSCNDMGLANARTVD